MFNLIDGHKYLNIKMMLFQKYRKGKLMQQKPKKEFHIPIPEKNFL